MHELSIALNIVDLCIEEAEKRRVRVEAVHLKLGALSSVVKEALVFSYEVATAGTLLENSKLIISETQGPELEVTALEVADEHPS